MSEAGPLIGARELAARLRRGQAPSLLDVRWELGRGALRAAYEAGHIPGAAFIDLDADLSGPSGPEGRHPLPGRTQFVGAMRRAGVSRARPVVVYDGSSSLCASRAWWQLRHAGHPDVRVLDGGLTAWAACGAELATGAEEPPAGDFDWDGVGLMPVLDAAGAAAFAAEGILIDARAPERYRGEVEPLDRVAGHIPGARNRPMAVNLQPDGRFCDVRALRESFAADGLAAEVMVGAYCGSGITAAHAVLALELAGFSAALYPGSWSEWVADPSRPVARGERHAGTSSRC